MLRMTKANALFFVKLCIFACVPMQSYAGKEAKMTFNHEAGVSSQIFEKAKKNEDWKNAYLTGKDAQIVFMNIAPTTNPNNEVGMETHKFDQVIFVAEGSAKAILNGKTFAVESGDMIFIPQGTEHNVINLNAKKPLKIFSVYSAMDIPAKAIYKTKSDEAE